MNHRKTLPGETVLKFKKSEKADLFRMDSRLFTSHNLLLVHTKCRVIHESSNSFSSSFFSKHHTAVYSDSEYSSRLPYASQPSFNCTWSADSVRIAAAFSSQHTKTPTIYDESLIGAHFLLFRVVHHCTIPAVEQLFQTAVTLCQHFQVYVQLKLCSTPCDSLLSSVG